METKQDVPFIRKHTYTKNKACVSWSVTFQNEKKIPIKFNHSAHFDFYKKHILNSLIVLSINLLI